MDSVTPLPSPDDVARRLTSTKTYREAQDAIRAHLETAVNIEKPIYLGPIDAFMLDELRLWVERAGWMMSFEIVSTSAGAEAMVRLCRPVSSALRQRGAKDMFYS